MTNNIEEAAKAYVQLRASAVVPAYQQHIQTDFSEGALWERARVLKIIDDFIRDGGERTFYGAASREEGRIRIGILLTNLIRLRGRVENIPPSVPKEEYVEKLKRTGEPRLVKALLNGDFYDKE